MLINIISRQGWVIVPCGRWQPQPDRTSKKKMLCTFPMGHEALAKYDGITSTAAVLIFPGMGVMYWSDWIVGCRNRFYTLDQRLDANSKKPIFA